MICSQELQEKLDMNAKKYAAEAIGTFWLTFAGCGSAVIAAAFPQVGIGLVGVSLGIRAERRDDGLRDRSYVRLPSQSRGDRRPCRGRPLSGRTDRALCDCATDRRRRSVGASLCDREWRRRVRRQQGLCVERLRRAFARPVQHGRMLHHGSCHDDDVSLHHHGRDPWQRAGRLRAAGDRTWRW